MAIMFFTSFVRFVVPIELPFTLLLAAFTFQEHRPRILFPTTVKNYGILTEGTTIRDLFTFKNTGSAPLEISRLTPS